MKVFFNFSTYDLLVMACTNYLLSKHQSTNVSDSDDDDDNNFYISIVINVKPLITEYYMVEGYHYPLTDTILKPIKNLLEFTDTSYQPLRDKLKRYVLDTEFNRNRNAYVIKALRVILSSIPDVIEVYADEYVVNDTVKHNDFITVFNRINKTDLEEHILDVLGYISMLYTYKNANASFHLHNNNHTSYIQFTKVNETELSNQIQNYIDTYGKVSNIEDITNSNVFVERTSDIIDKSNIDECYNLISKYQFNSTYNYIVDVVNNDSKLTSSINPYINNLLV